MKYQLLWQGSTDDYAASTFHSKCNGKGPTLTVVQSDKGNVFGGYTSESWGFGGGGAYKYDATAFVYSLTHKAKCDKQKEPEYSIHDDSSYGPVFGGGMISAYTIIAIRKPTTIATQQFLMNCQPVPTTPS